MNKLSIQELYKDLNDLSLMLVERLNAQDELESRSYTCHGLDGHKTITNEGN